MLISSIDVSDYPSSHTYILCTDSSDVPASINNAMEDIGDFSGVQLDHMLEKVARVLSKATAGSQANPISLDTMSLDGSDEDDDFQQLQSEDEGQDEDEDLGLSDDDDYDDDWDMGPKSLGSRATNALSSKSIYVRPKDRDVIAALNERIRNDLRYVKDAGFRVGHLGMLMNGGQDSFITISCRISKLGISEEALQAWNLEPNLYFLVVIRYSSGYQSYTQLAQDGVPGCADVHIRVGLSCRYKINIAEAIEAFSKTTDKKKEASRPEDTGEEFKQEGLMPFFISRALNDLLNSQLVPCLRYRDRYAFTWDGAEEYFYDHQGMGHEMVEGLGAKYWKEEAAKIFLPNLVTGDHLADLRSKNMPTRHASFPLLTIQFALRHLVRCTEFCLVCHCRVPADFEALKPYVCDKPLCLYQYMALGFGPSIEHEILSQPYVVDLLISFCYSSASTQKALKTFPVGMGLTVPAPHLIPGQPLQPERPVFDPRHRVQEQASNAQYVSSSGKSHTAKFDVDRMELIFASDDQSRPLRLGNWVCISKPDNSEQRMHCRVIETLYPVVRLGIPIVGRVWTMEGNIRDMRDGLPLAKVANDTALTPAATPPLGLSRQPTTTRLPEVEYTVYDQNFDDLPSESKQKVIRILLDTLPSVLEMKEYLQSSRHKTLLSWVDRLSPAALGVLRWIIASNRSCIIQVDNLEGGSKKSEERVSGMPDYMQFRFAQGAPDKEQRFITSMRSELPHMRDPQYPTLFAWHGSSLFNWHSIVREGLHFKEVINGRAFGNGVYFSPHAQTSLGYSSGNFYGHHSYTSTSETGGAEKALSPWMWPPSQLRISDALSLNEIVNRPEKFQSSSPHYVVAQLDWIQTRYLFVRCNNSALTSDIKRDVVPSSVYYQDPRYAVMGAKSIPVVIPLTAVSKSRRPSTSIKSEGKKKAKLATDKDSAVYLSEDTGAEDLAIFFPTAEERAPERSPPHRPAITPAKTDFCPGSLDHSTLPILEPPAMQHRPLPRPCRKSFLRRSKFKTPPLYMSWDGISILISSPMFINGSSSYTHSNLNFLFLKI